MRPCWPLFDTLAARDGLFYTAVTIFQAFTLLEMRLIEYIRIWNEMVKCSGKGESKTKMRIML